MNSDLFSWHTHSNSLDELKVGLDLAKESGAKSLMVLTCDQNHYSEQHLTVLLKSCLLPIFGGIYPMITHQETLIKQGALIIGFNEIYETSLFSDLHQVQDEEDLEAKINRQLESQHNFNVQDNFLMLYDGLMTNIEDFLDSLFECLDHRITIAGGGAGHLDFIQRPCVFTHQGIYSNALLLVALPRKLTMGIAHGWETFQGPFLVSEAQGQTVLSLNHQPAFQVYSQAIESASSHKFESEDFFDIAKHYPLGIEDISSDLVVRDPILTHNDHLQCVGNVPINSMVYLLKGDINTLVHAAEEAAISVFSPPQIPVEKVVMVFDCISRVLYMEDNFDRELHAINKHCTSAVLFGVLSIGEIANSKSGAIRLLNKSTVISAW